MAKKILVNDEMLNLRTIPNLSEDKQWYELFKDVMDRKMKTLYKELQELTKREKELKLFLSSKKKEKKKLMNQILVYSDEVNSKGNVEWIAKLEESRDKIVLINDTIDNIMYQLEIIPSELRQMNYDLLKSSLSIAYQDLSDNKSKVDYLNIEIGRLRDKVVFMKEQKKNHEKSINSLYSYLHKTIGHKNTENLDDIFL